MKLALRCAIPVLVCGVGLAHAQISRFKHIVVIMQENRSPDSLFYSLCRPPFGSAKNCSTTPTDKQYNIQTSNWLDKTSPGGTIQPAPTPLGGVYGLNHGQPEFFAQCDADAIGACRMDGAASIQCNGTCPAHPQFKYVDNSTRILDPYLQLVTQYGWANYMFATQQGASFPAHQFIFGGTSAPSAEDDAMAIFAVENMIIAKGVTNHSAGCIADATTRVRLNGPHGYSDLVYPCFEHNTIPDILPGFSWRYYSPGAGSIWTAPDAISHICQSSGPGGQCEGAEWTDNVDVHPPDVLADISSCNLRNISWVIPSLYNSDHPQGIDNTGGPSWVASIVNAVGNNPRCPNGETYWNNTAILITWDEWGGWYDHEPPTILSGIQGDYQLGLRVPLIVVSAYTPAGFKSNVRHDFGSILLFIEHNFRVKAGALNFADQRATNNLGSFFRLNTAPRPFNTIPAPLDANYFLNDKRPPMDPDDD
jgi:phospholipase C